MRYRCFRLHTTLPRLRGEFESPISHLSFSKDPAYIAGMAELADAPDLESGSLRSAGSTPVPGIIALVV